MKMKSAGLRHRPLQPPSSALVPPSPSLIPPRYTIDLSLPPSQRYTHLARDFTSEVHSLPILFDQIVLQTGASTTTLKWTKRLARFGLRSLYSREETAEIRGISRDTGVGMYLLVAFNVLLDLFMGCTSGGVRVCDSGGRKDDGRMLHFRALDWGMPELRRVVVMLDFVRERSGPVVATSVTYFGYVGVLTGVRKGLSVSLNFRPLHDTSTWWKGSRFTIHQLLVLFGWRRSISSLLRECLIPKGQNLESVEEMVERVRQEKSTAAYLIFCTGQEAFSLEKDYDDAETQSDGEFIITMNHDVANEKSPQEEPDEATAGNDSLMATGMLPIVSYSVRRKKCVEKLWSAAKRRRAKGMAHITMPDMMKWLKDEDINNTQTHYMCLMDPTVGEVLWIERHLEAVTPFEQIMATVRKGR